MWVNFSRVFAVRSDDAAVAFSRLPRHSSWQDIPGDWPKCTCILAFFAMYNNNADNFHTFCYEKLMISAVWYAEYHQWLLIPSGLPLQITLQNCCPSSALAFILDLIFIIFSLWQTKQNIPAICFLSILQFSYWVETFQSIRTAVLTMCRIKYCKARKAVT